MIARGNRHMRTISSKQEDKRRLYKRFAGLSLHDKPRSGIGRLSWLLVLACWILVWQLAYWLVHQDFLLASPAQVFDSLAHMLMTRAFWLSVLFSMLRIQAGYLLGMVVGTGLAILTVRIHWLHRLFHPVIGAIRATPVASFIILTLVWMSSSRVVIFIVFLMVLPIVWSNVAEGIRKTDPKLLEMAFVFHLSKNQIIRQIYLPSVAPFFVTAATSSLGLGWKAGVAAEVLGRPSFSLGGSLYDAKIYLATSDLFAYTCVVIILSLILERLLVWIFRHAGHPLVRHDDRQSEKRDSRDEGKEVSVP